MEIESHHADQQHRYLSRFYCTVPTIEGAKEFLVIQAAPFSPLFFSFLSPLPPLSTFFFCLTGLNLNIKRFSFSPLFFSERERGRCKTHAEYLRNAAPTKKKRKKEREREKKTLLGQRAKKLEKRTFQPPLSHPLIFFFFRIFLLCRSISPPPQSSHKDKSCLPLPLPPPPPPLPPPPPPAAPVFSASPPPSESDSNKMLPRGARPERESAR